ncbi:MAG TPA: putative DNA-binding domain-containing protein [Polyangiaceae bacterium]
MNLAELEEWFFRSVRSAEPPADLHGIVAGGPGLSPARRLGLYHSMYFERQVRVLEDIFQRTATLMGGGPFRDAALAYLREHPSRAPAIERIADGFPEFLGGLPEADVPPRAVLELARLERARLATLLAEDSNSTFDESWLASELVASRRVALASDISIERVSHRALQLWQGEDQSASLPDDSEAAVSIVFHRRGSQVVQLRVSEEEADALLRARQAATFAEVCECFTEPGGVSRAASALTRWIRQRWLVALAVLTALTLTLACGEPPSEFGFDVGPTMRPGDDCLRCHSAGSDYPSAPDFTAAGTVFPEADSALTRGVSGVEVQLTDSTGAILERLTTNSVGNFYTTRPLPSGFRVALEYGGSRVEMPCPPPAGNCGACHSLPPIGEAQGRIFVPGGGELASPALDCETWTRAEH